MIVSIPEDIYGYESKPLGNFTIRQAICFALSLGVIAPTVVLLYWFTGSVDLAAVAAMLLGFPVLMCGFFKRDGLYLEKIALIKLRWRFRYPCRRPYRMGNLYEDLRKEAEALELEEKRRLGGGKKAEKTQKGAGPLG